MNIQEQIKNDFLEALQGDGDAIDRVSARLAAATATQAEGQDRDAILDAAAEFRQNFRDVVSNPDVYAAVVKVDAQLARSPAAGLPGAPRNRRQCSARRELW